MKVRIVGPQRVRGTLRPPSSKAYTHRAFVASLLAQGLSTIERPLRCDDTDRTLGAIGALGASVSRDNTTVRVQGIGAPSTPQEPVDCGESGAALRFLTAISATSQGEVILNARGPLAGRPILPLLEALKNLGAQAGFRQNEGFLELRVRGPLQGGSTTIPGDVSSQFISGLLLAAPFASKSVDINLTGKLESRPYVEMTLKVLRKHGVRVQRTLEGFRVAAPQAYQPAFHKVPSDFSSAAFLLAAAATAGDNLTIPMLQESSFEPDSIILGILSEMGARLERSGDNLRVSISELKGFEFDASDHPDLVPVLEVLACRARGTSGIRGLRRLRHKESNRLETVPEELKKMGADISINDDTVQIKGPQHLCGAELLSHHDHRVAMTCATASLTAKGTTLIEEAEVVSKSYPDFYDDLRKLGVRLDVE